MTASERQWWQTFFDDAYVEAWAADGAFESTGQMAEQLIDFIDLPAGARVLDIPCGFGRFAKPLQDAGYDVTAVDASADQFRLARQDNGGPTTYGRHARTTGRSVRRGVEPVQQLRYFEDPADDMRCLISWFEVLRPGGLLVVETMHRDRLAWLWGQDSDPGTRRETGTTDWTTGVRTSTVQIDGETREFTVRLYTVTDLVQMMHEVGFVQIEAFGGLDASQLDPSKRLAIRARRP